MPESAREFLIRYLVEAIRAEQNLESQFRRFSEEGDDAEVQRCFADFADGALRHRETIARRLDAQYTASSKTTDLIAELLALAPKAVQVGANAEERLTQNLIASFSMLKAGCALYSVIAELARLAGEETLSLLTRALADDYKANADTTWHFLPTRSKIAFNVATAGEIDPAIETRAPDDRVRLGIL